MERSSQYNSRHSEHSTIDKGMDKTPYELWFGYSPSVKYFRIFGSKCYIKRNGDIGKFYPRSDEGMFLGYSLKSKAFICFNYRTKTIVEWANIRIDEKFGTKERIMEYNSDEEPKITNNVLLQKTTMTCKIVHSLK